MKYRTIFSIAAALLLFCSAATASTWQMDPDHTEIRFEVTHILTGVSGRFTDFKGTIFFDPQNPKTAKFDFTVDVGSVNTQNGKRDNHLRSKDFFDADRYPQMRFQSSNIVRVNPNMYRMEGDLTIKDVTRKVEMAFEFIPPTPHPFAKGKQVAGFVTQFTVARLDYGVGNGKFLKMGVVGPDVDVMIVMEALTAP